mmetsp:Transcript_13695/g.40205  ORF Transcript_13695/g.40205 Transcript_13695/m.40205 type:complete len:114 (-) Transcript_13695:390-731(-)
MRYTRVHQRGALTNPDEVLRREAIELTLEGCRWAEALGAEELVVWSAFDGYDYHLQADHTAMWTRAVEAFREVCDAFPRPAAQSRSPPPARRFCSRRRLAARTLGSRSTSGTA